MSFLKIFSTVIFSILIATLGSAQPDMDEKGSRLKDQQILDDLIVDGSACIGLDCVNGENFGFNTIRLKENNLRIRFFDTSTSASFPTRDWELEANSSSNGGTEHFAINDIDGGRTPFKIIAGAPTNSLFVSSAGRLGLGTGTPSVNLHIKTGNTPTMRLEQDGSSGFTAQTWDVAGNEAGFFVRDATNGSTLPFRILPGASSQALVIAGNDEIGIGAGTNPAAKFHIENTGGDDEDDFVVTSDGRVGIGTTAPSGSFQVVVNQATNPLNVLDPPTGSLQIGSISSVATPSLGGFQSEDNRVGLYLFSQTSESNNGGDMVFSARENNNTAFTSITNKAFVFQNFISDLLVIRRNGDILQNGGVIHMASDKRLKSNIQPFERGLDEVLKLNPVTYKYNGKAGIQKKETVIGLVAQELQKVVPEMVSPFQHDEKDELGNIKSSKEYLSIHVSELPFLLIKAIQDQQSILEDQKSEIEKMKKEASVLKEMVLEMRTALDRISSVDVILEDEKGAFIKQNIPNPFNGKTQIAYSIPQSASNAVLRVSNINGQLLKEIQIIEKGNGFIDIEASHLPQGSYTYSLFVDGDLVGTKQMVLAK